MSINRVAALTAIAQDALCGEITFTAHAHLALKIQSALNDPDCELSDAVRLIQAEPLLAARVLAMANSVAINRSGKAIISVQSAVTRLGLRLVRMLAAATVARQIATTISLSDDHKKLALQLWDHSAHVAALASTIARRVTHQDPEIALFAGIIHETGGFYLLSRAGDYPELFSPVASFSESEYAPDRDADECDDDGVVEAAHIAEGEGDIGRAVLKALCIPDEVVEAIETLWKGYLSFPAESIGDTLLIADQLSPVKSPLCPGPDVRSPKAEYGLDLLIEERTLLGILEEAGEEIRSLTEVLRM